MIRILVLVLLSGCTFSAPIAENVTVEEATTLVARPDMVVLDVRTDEEFTAGHIAGAIQLDFYAADFAAQLDQLDRKTPYLIYCGSGKRSGKTLEQMHDLGFQEVYNMYAGFPAWHS
ncbi:MAG: rhodanese-like domain-containing protein [Candidatus Woesearchaeota archaeon]|nr:rhodanese-like domain-containing protein [Candidatus Woesearchaeota archaeon]